MRYVFRPATTRVCVRAPLAPTETRSHVPAVASVKIRNADRRKRQAALGRSDLERHERVRRRGRAANLSHSRKDQCGHRNLQQYSPKHLGWNIRRSNRLWTSARVFVSECGFGLCLRTEKRDSIVFLLALSIGGRRTGRRRRMPARPGVRQLNALRRLLGRASARRRGLSFLRGTGCA